MTFVGEQASGAPDVPHRLADVTRAQEKRRLSPMRLLAATVLLTVLAVAWYFALVPPFLALAVAAALAIWGLDIDWRRTQRLADLKIEAAPISPSVET